MKPINEIAADLGIPLEGLESYGNHKAKIKLETLQSAGNKRRQGKLILVTSINPTPQGEGKTVTAIGLSSALNRLGHRSIVCTRQPSLGPLFGIKGGAAGGGKSTVEPMLEINMRFTGDIDAVGAAHNLLSAMIDNHIFHGNELGINPRTIRWSRTVDMNDRALRHVIVGLDTKNDERSREDSFVITAASEVMAILSLSKGYRDLKARLDEILLGFDSKGSPVKAKDLRASGAMSAILKDALEPNLVQTSDETPALVHCGPFGNIATGTSSLVSILLGLYYSDYCVVEAGFGSDLGAEKFVDIVSRLGHFEVDVAVIVVSIKALKFHGAAEELVGSERMSVGRNQMLESSIVRGHMSSGLANLQKHIENIRLFGIPPVVAINRFSTDTDDELKTVMDFCRGIGVSCAISNVFAEGANGGRELAQLVSEVSSGHHANIPVYGMNDNTKEKIEKVVRKVYGGSEVIYEQQALDDIATIRGLGLTDSPICIAKTPSSLSDDPKKLGRPTSFSVRVSRIGISSGAGFSVPYMGEIMTMPGLPSHPAAEKMYLRDNGEIVGLF